MIDFITEFLDLNLNGLDLVSFNSDDHHFFIHLSMKLTSFYCPKCGYKMVSNGIYTRTIHHPVTQNGKELIIFLDQRRWKCRNCGFSFNQQNHFVEPRMRHTPVTQFLAIDMLRELEDSVSEIAQRLHVSDTYVFKCMEQLINVPRPKLPKYLSVDEVFLNTQKNKKYALVLMDFETRNIIDIVISRREIDTSDYFLSYPYKERMQVSYLISDMYKPYKEYTDKYFHRALHVVDQFHVIADLVRRIREHIYSIRKDYDTDSVEYYMLKNYSWILLKNESNIKNYQLKRYDDCIMEYMNTQDYVDRYMSIHPSFEPIHELKEMFIQFYHDQYDTLEDVGKVLDDFIELFSNSEFELFREFSSLLRNNRESIINSFIEIEVTLKDGTTRKVRLSNGPMESSNRKIKSLKRNNRGIKNFKHAHKRVLHSEGQTTIKNTTMKFPKKKEKR